MKFVPRSLLGYAPADVGARNGSERLDGRLGRPVVAGAKVSDFALFAVRSAGAAAAAAMPDEPMTEECPLFLRDELDQVLLYLFRRFLSG